MSDFDTNSGVVTFMVSIIMTTTKPALVLAFRGLLIIEWP